jgi:hypothetical protein
MIDKSHQVNLQQPLPDDATPSSSVDLPTRRLPSRASAGAPNNSNACVSGKTRIFALPCVRAVVVAIMLE